VLEDGMITPVGAAQPRHVDVRVVSATNADITSKIASGEFRHDLFYRLARYTVETPPLRSRPEDLPLLAEHFLNVFATEMGLAAPPLTKEALSVLSSYSFPGNVRELKNIIERALIMSGGKPIKGDHMQLIDGSTSVATPVVTVKPATSTSSDIPLNLEAAEHALIQRALEQTHGNVAEAARLLGVNRSRIYRRFPDLAGGVA
jgi:DNA-binding NtrC family response regulator